MVTAQQHAPVAGAVLTVCLCTLSRAVRAAMQLAAVQCRTEWSVAAAGPFDPAARGLERETGARYAANCGRWLARLRRRDETRRDETRRDETRRDGMVERRDRMGGEAKQNVADARPDTKGRKG